MSVVGGFRRELGLDVAVIGRLIRSAQFTFAVGFVGAEQPWNPQSTRRDAHAVCGWHGSGGVVALHDLEGVEEFGIPPEVIVEDVVLAALGLAHRLLIEARRKTAKIALEVRPLRQCRDPGQSSLSTIQHY